MDIHATLLSFLGYSCTLAVRTVQIVIIGFLMFSCSLLDRSGGTEVNYTIVLAVRGRGFELWLLKVPEN